MATACGQIEEQCGSLNHLYSELETGPHTDIKDPEITPYIEEFVNDFKGLVPDEMLNPDNLYSYRYESLPTGDDTSTIGQCIVWSSGERELLISPKLHDQVFAQKAVIYHELGHCLFGLGHDANEKPSLMSEYLITSELYWKSNWPEELEKFKVFVASEVK